MSKVFETTTLASNILTNNQYETIYKDFLTSGGEGDINSNNFMRFVEEMNDVELEDILEGIKIQPQLNHLCVINGTLGLWSGTREIEPCVMIDVYHAISKCLRSGADYYSIKQQDGFIEVECTHHDGTNKFNIHLLNKRGTKVKDTTKLTDKKYFKRTMYDFCY